MFKKTPKNFEELKELIEQQIKIEAIENGMTPEAYKKDLEKSVEIMDRLLEFYFLLEKLYNCYQDLIYIIGTKLGYKPETISELIEAFRELKKNEL